MPHRHLAGAKDKYVYVGYVSRDTSPIIGQRKWSCPAYLKDISGLLWKQWNIWIRRSCTMWLIKIIGQIKVIRQ